MNKLKFLSAGLIATAMFAAPAIAREQYLPPRAAAAIPANVSNSNARYISGCVRAPDVGAYATQPYVVPPCEPTGQY